MSRSFFVVNSRETVQSQLLAASSELRNREPSLDGPFMDYRKALEQLSVEVRNRMRTVPDPVTATLLTTAPQNFPRGGQSWLKVPFIMSIGEEIAGDAGSLASSSSRWLGSEARIIDHEGLTLIATAVMRRLGIPAYYAYMHYDESHLLRIVNASGAASPCIFIAEDAQIVSVLPPFMLNLGGQKGISSLEILDDDAIASLVYVKIASRECAELMHDVAERKIVIAKEGKMRAMAIGHTVQYASELWGLMEAAGEAERLEQRFPSRRFQSMREVAEDEYFHPIICPLHQGLVASSIMLCDNAIEALEYVIEAAKQQGADIQKWFKAVLGMHPCSEKLFDYLELVGDINSHLHSSKECPEMRKMH